MVNITKMTAGEGQLCGRVQKMVQSVLFSTNNLAKSANTGVHLWNEYQIVIKECDSILQLFEDLKLPKAKPRVLELTDAGPGVGCNNNAVQYRIAGAILIHGHDKVVRVHRGRGDSGQNEAERTNAAISDALVTGETLDWEYHKRFENMSTDEIEALYLQEYEHMEEERMKKMHGEQLQN